MARYPTTTIEEISGRDRVKWLDLLDYFQLLASCPDVRIGVV